MKGKARKLAGLIALALLIGLALAPTSGMTQETGTYTNAVSEGTVDTFPDPAVIKAKDGYWYAYGTTNPVFQSRGESGERYLPIMRSKDMVNWEYAGQVFDSPSQFPSWFGQDARLWAPDVRYIDGEYYLYYSVAGGGGGIGLATAPTPTGPWTDSGGTVVPKGTQDCPTNDIDQAQFTDTDGKHYLYWGSYDVVCAAEMNADATRIVGTPKEVLISRRGEGPFVVRHDDFYYMFYSESTCCSGAFSGYQVKVGRSESPMGPFVDDRGTPLTALEPKEGFVLAANGNRWIGPGHHAHFTDLSGQDYFAYHAIPEEDPDLDPTPSLGGRRLTTRPLLIDRLDWIDGWPTVRAGEWASDTAQPAPVTEWTAGDDFNGRDSIGGQWRREGESPGGWRLQTEQDAGGYVRQAKASDKPSYLVSAEPVPEDLRAEADLRMPTRSNGSAGLITHYEGPNNYVVSWLNAGTDELVTGGRVKGRGIGVERTPLPENFTVDEWHNVAVEVRGQTMKVQVTGDRLSDPLAVQERELPAAVDGGSVGVAAQRTTMSADNVGGAPLYEPVTEKVPDPEAGVLDPAYSDEFDDGVNPGSEPASPWTWVRAPEGGEANGTFNWTTDGGELAGTNNSASVLKREAPEGEYIVETKLNLNPQSTFQQAGLVLYGNDNNYVKLAHVRINMNPDYGGRPARVTEFAKEGPRPDFNDPAAYAATYVGPPAQTMYIRLQHRLDPEEGEHDVRAATSIDGERWVWGGVWSVPSDLDLDIGLVALNTAGAQAQFDYVRTYRP